MTAPTAPPPATEADAAELARRAFAPGDRVKVFGGQAPGVVVRMEDWVRNATVCSPWLRDSVYVDFGDGKRTPVGRENCYWLPRDRELFVGRCRAISEYFGAAAREGEQ